MSGENVVCQVCGDQGKKRIIRSREMMFGYRDIFDYSECAGCGSLTLVNVPADLGKYYPRDYFSFREISDLGRDAGDSPFIGYLRRARSAYLLSGQNIVGRLVAMVKPAPELLDWYLGCFRKHSLGFGARILDVGCGNGRLLQELARFGFRDLTGIDPFIPEEITYGSGVRVLRKELREFSGRFDVVMLNHAFEHLPQPAGVMERLAGLLPENGLLMIRTPTVSSFAWKRYQGDWVQLDAPRHLFIYSLGGIEKLASGSGFTVQDVRFDSTEFQFWGSQQYERDIPLLSGDSIYLHPEKSIFSPGQIRAFRAHAARLNREKQGDQICVLLVKKGSPDEGKP